MKIKHEHINFIKDSIAALSLVEKIKAHRDVLRLDDRVKDLEKRLRWDMLYAAVSSKWIGDNLYPYMNDTHIDSALKSIAKEIGV